MVDRPPLYREKEEAFRFLLLGAEKFLKKLKICTGVHEAHAEYIVACRNKFDSLLDRDVFYASHTTQCQIFRHEY